MRMKAAFAIVAAMLATPLTAQAPASLPGVENEETQIPSGAVREYHRGHGDVIFVRHQTDRWYRVQLNEGCLSTLARSDQLLFDRSSPNGRIDRFTRVRQPVMGTTCTITSIRRSAAPPQVDSNSPITLD
jgi:hypothetical protein